MRRAYRRPGRRRAKLRLPTKNQLRILLIIALVTALAFYISKAAAFLKELSSNMALSDATDLITLAINDAINRKMSESDFGYDYFVTLEKDNNGDITAITTNMSRINYFSTEILSDVVHASDSGQLNIGIPLGNLLGFNLALGRGPEIPVEIIMLTSSYADFRNEMVSAGINQTKYQLVLEVVVDIDILVPWETISTEVKTETLIAETVIVGEVPETYFNME